MDISCLPTLPFEEEEFGPSHILLSGSVPTLSKWRKLKMKRGLLRCDLTRILDKTSDGMPKVNAYQGNVPSDLIGINEMRREYNPFAFIHCFSDDSVLEKLWNEPCEHFNVIGQYSGMLSADFSMKLDMAPAENFYNCFRNHALAQMSQNQGIDTIYTLSWAGYGTLDYAFDGIESGGVYAVSTMGTNRDYVSRKFFKIGLCQAVKQLEPKKIIIYGDEIDFAIKCPLVTISNKFILRLRQLDRSELGAG